MNRRRGVELEGVKRGAVTDADRFPVHPNLRFFVDAAAPEEEAAVPKLRRDIDGLPVPREALVVAEALVAPRGARRLQALPISARDVFAPEPDLLADPH